MNCQVPLSTCHKDLFRGTKKTMCFGDVSLVGGLTKQLKIVWFLVLRCKALVGVPCCRCSGVAAEDHEWASVRAAAEPERSLKKHPSEQVLREV